MSDRAYNALTDAEDERLALLIEECGEVVQAAAKVLRHGYETCGPSGNDNRSELETEIGDLMNSIRMLYAHRDIDEQQVGLCERIKRDKIGQYLHHTGAGR